MSENCPIRAAAVLEDDIEDVELIQPHPWASRYIIRRGAMSCGRVSIGPQIAKIIPTCPSPRTCKNVLATALCVANGIRKSNENVE